MHTELNKMIMLSKKNYPMVKVFYALLAEIMYKVWRTRCQAIFKGTVTDVIVVWRSIVFRVSARMPYCIKQLLVV